MNKCDGELNTISLNSSLRGDICLPRPLNTVWTRVFIFFCFAWMPFLSISMINWQYIETTSGLESVNLYLTMLKNFVICSSCHPLAGVSSLSLPILGISSQIWIALSAASFLTSSRGLDILLIKLFCSSIENVLKGIVWAEFEIWFTWLWALKLFWWTGFVIDKDTPVDLRSYSASGVNFWVCMNSKRRCFDLFQSCFAMNSAI